MGKYAIFIVSALIFSMLTYSTALRNALFQSEFRNIESFSQMQAYNVANSAALVVINDIRNESDSDFVPDEDETYSYPSSSGFQNWADLAGAYNIQVTNQADTLLVLQSTGRFQESNYRVTVGMTKGGTSEWLGASVDKAIHSESEMTLGNSQIEGDLSLNSSHSDFYVNNPNVEGSLYFYDEGIVYDDELEEYEDMFTAPDDASDDYSHMYQLSEKIQHPNPIFPQFTVSGTKTYNGKNNEILFQSDLSQHFDAFNSGGATINTGGDENTEIKIYTKSLDLRKDLAITGEGRVSFYVENSLELGNGNINNKFDPESKNLTIYYKGKEGVSQTGNGTFRGTLFADSNTGIIDVGGTPIFDGNIISLGNKQVKIHGNPEVSSLVFAPYSEVVRKGSAGSFRGAIVSDTYKGSGQPTIIYDENFASTLPPLEQEDDNEFVMLYWN